MLLWSNWLSNWHSWVFSNFLFWSWKWSQTLLIFIQKSKLCRFDPLFVLKLSCLKLFFRILIFIRFWLKGIRLILAKDIVDLLLLYSIYLNIEIVGFTHKVVSNTLYWMWFLKLWNHWFVVGIFTMFCW